MMMSSIDQRYFLQSNYLQYIDLFNVVIILLVQKKNNNRDFVDCEYFSYE